MPSYSRGGKRDNFFCCKANPLFFYIFKGADITTETHIKDSDLTVLGLKKIGNNLSALITNSAASGTAAFAVGANNPRPPRMVKKISDSQAPATQASVSSYCAYDRIAEAMRNGWNIGNMGTEFSIKRSGRTVTVAIALESIFYCWNMNADDMNTYGPTLGMIPHTELNAEREIQKIVFGASRPKPPKVRKAAKSADGATTSGSFSSFCSPAKYEELIRDQEWHSVSKYIPLLTPAEVTKLGQGQ